MSQFISIETLKTPIGELIAGDYQGNICLLDWKYRKMRDTTDGRIKRGLNAEFNNESTPLIDDLKSQLACYFSGELHEFNIPVTMIGTEFQKQVWNSLLEIPYGETRSYLQLSRQLGNEKAIRAIAAANGANAMSIIIPCHRIIGSNGEMIGYAGGIQAKQKLLQIESKEPFIQSTLF